MKRNGCTCPSNFSQILTFILYIIKISTYVIFTIPVLIEVLEKLIYTILIITYCLLLFFTFLILLLATLKDPSDPYLKLEIEKKEEAKKLKTNYVLEINKQMDFCLICCSNIKSTSKHCKTCDRCVDGFDHHCMWLNNCIGKENYSLFIYLLISFIIFSLFSTVSIGYICIKALNEIDKNNIVFAYSITSLCFLSLDAIVLVNVVYLVCVHIYLKCKGLTTFEYIMLKNELKVEEGKGSNNLNNNNQIKNIINYDNNDMVKENIKNNPDQNEQNKDHSLQPLKQKGRNKIHPLHLLNKIDDNKNVVNQENKIIINDANYENNIFKPLAKEAYSVNKETETTDNKKHLVISHKNKNNLNEGSKSLESFYIEEEEKKVDSKY